MGEKPTYEDVSVLFGQYFSINKPGSPVQIPYSNLSASSFVDQDALNKIMATLIFNIDVLYDAYHEDVESLYSLLSAYIFRLNNLKNKRAEVEKKIDDYLFSINNTDGFYYSFTNAFNDLETTDIENTTAYVDTNLRKVTLPKITSGTFNYVGNILDRATTAEVAIFFDGERKDIRQGVDFSQVSNGLNNSRWTYVGADGTNGYKSSTIGSCVLRVSVSSSFLQSVGVSNVEGKLISRKPVDTSVVVNDPTDANNSLFYSKSGATDYDVFSFNFESKPTGRIDIFFTKVEPDYVINENEQNKSYVYDFTIDELIISAPYFDAAATYISNPVQIVDSKNKNIIIDAVMLEANEQIPAGCQINYYVAEDSSNGSAEVSQLNWNRISPTSSYSSNSENVVRFNGTTEKAMKLISKTGDSILPTETEFIKIPRTTEFQNPIQNYFYQSDYSNYDFNLYRLAKFPTGVDAIYPYILENVLSQQVKASYVIGTTLNNDAWQEIITGYRKDVSVISSDITIPSTDVFFSGNSTPAGSVYLSTNVYCDTDSVYKKNLMKTIDAQYWDVSVYLNGRLLANLEPGAMFSSVTWNFLRGQNSIDIIINNYGTTNSGSTFQGSLTLMEGMSLSNTVGITPYQNYLFQVKVEDLRLKYSNTDNVFSIINWENNKEIVYRRTKEISDGSIVYYLQNLDNGITGLRVRADLLRGTTAYSSPAIISYKLKFRH